MLSDLRFALLETGFAFAQLSLAFDVVGRLAIESAAAALHFLEEVLEFFLLLREHAIGVLEILDSSLGLLQLFAKALGFDFQSVGAGFGVLAEERRERFLDGDHVFPGDVIGGDPVLLEEVVGSLEHALHVLGLVDNIRNSGSNTLNDVVQLGLIGNEENGQLRLGLLQFRYEGEFLAVFRQCRIGNRQVVAILTGRFERGLGRRVGADAVACAR